MKIIETNFEGNGYYFCEFSPNEYEFKLVNAVQYFERKSVKQFCDENQAELAINGGLFNYSSAFALNNATKFIDGIQNSEGIIVNNGSSSKPCIFYGEDGTMWSSIFSDIKERGVKCKWAREVAYYGLIYEGEMGCFSLGYPLNQHKVVDKYIEKHKRTMIGQKYDKTIILACSKGEITGEQQARFMKHRGCKWAFNLDGGGSSHMYDGINKKYVVKGDRNVTDALVVVKKNKYVVPDTSDTSNISFKMLLTGSAARLRTQEINGSIKTTVPKGQSIEIVGLYGWKAGDGYRWAWGKYNGIDGAFQYDPAVMMPVGKPEPGKYKMKLHSSAARLRSSIRGTILTTVPNYNDIQIIEFINGKQSDGYQWCYGEYNGTRGYFQYDPKVMYPTND